MLVNMRHFVLPNFLDEHLTHYESINHVLLINHPTSTHQWVSSSAMKTVKMTLCSHLCGELGGGGTMKRLNPVAVNLAPIPKSGRPFDMIEPNILNLILIIECFLDPPVTQFW